MADLLAAVPRILPTDDEGGQSIPAPSANKARRDRQGDHPAPPTGRWSHREGNASEGGSSTLVPTRIWQRAGSAGLRAECREELAQSSAGGDTA